MCIINKQMHVKFNAVCKIVRFVYQLGEFVRNVKQDMLWNMTVEVVIKLIMNIAVWLVLMRED